VKKVREKIDGNISNWQGFPRARLNQGLELFTAGSSWFHAFVSLTNPILPRLQPNTLTAASSRGEHELPLLYEKWVTCITCITPLCTPKTIFFLESFYSMDVYWRWDGNLMFFYTLWDSFLVQSSILGLLRRTPVGSVLWQATETDHFNKLNSWAFCINNFHTGQFLRQIATGRRFGGCPRLGG
jgi:hypothetical protein